METSQHHESLGGLLRGVDQIGQQLQGVWLQHPGFADGTREIDFDDADALRAAGFLSVDEPGNYGGFHFVVAPAALRACRDLPREGEHR